MSKKYINCPTCGSICKPIPQPPKEPIYLVTMDDFDRNNLIREASKNDLLMELVNNNGSLRQILDAIPFNELWRYIKARIRGFDPICWSDLQDNNNNRLL